MAVKLVTLASLCVAALQATPGPITEDQYHAAAKAVADAGGSNVTFLDMSSLLGNWVTMNANGWMGDNLHPNNAGHAAYAAVLAGII